VTGNARATMLQFSTKQSVVNGAYQDHGVMIIRTKEQEIPVITIGEISISGEHNLQNAMAAALAAQITGVSTASIRSTLRNFKGVEHRQEFVRDVNGISFINNSKATTVEAVEAALKSYDEPIVLIMGGKDKGNDYSTIRDLVKKKVKAIVATGYSADMIVKNFKGLVRVEKVATIGEAIPNTESMQRTIDTALSLADRGDIVLLAPACTSFDWFVDYEERGRVFKQLVNQL
jgi:UDP-N-acetylmuramoylalanine--D-glutamate ligase